MTWKDCGICGLFRECESIIPPRRFWKKIINANRLLITRRFICTECHDSFGHTVDSYYKRQEAVYQGFENEI